MSADAIFKANTAPRGGDHLEGAGEHDRAPVDALEGC